MAVKNYPHDRGKMIHAICDIVELQKGKFTFSDTKNGMIHFMVSMYGFKWEYRFSVTNLGDRQSQVCLEMAGEELGRDDMLRKELNLLDSMLDYEKQFYAENNLFLKKVLERVKRREARDKRPELREKREERQ